MDENKMKKLSVLIALILAANCGNKKIDYKDKMYAEITTNMGTMKIELWHDKTPKTVENFISLAMGQKEWTNPSSGKKSDDNFYDGLIFHRVIKDFMIQGGCPLGNGTGGPGYNFEDETFDKSKASALSDKISSPAEANLVFEQVVVPYLRKTQNPDKDLINLIKECQTKQSYDPIMKKPVSFFTSKTGFEGQVMTSGELIAPVEYGTICMANSGPNTNGSQFFIVTKKDGCPWLNGRHTVFGKVVEGMDVAEKIQVTAVGENDKPVKDVVIEKIRLL